MILGDNIFYAHGLFEKLRKAMKRKRGATVFGYWVKDPECYGVVTFDENDRAIDIEEKPTKSTSNYPITGSLMQVSNFIQVIEER